MHYLKTAEKIMASTLDARNAETIGRVIALHEAFSAKATGLQGRELAHHYLEEAARVCEMEAEDDIAEALRYLLGAFEA